MNTIGDMQDEMYFYSYCNEFEYNHDYVIIFMKNWNISMYMCESIFIFVSSQ